MPHIELVRRIITSFATSKYLCVKIIDRGVDWKCLLSIPELPTKLFGVFA